jgi:hypothetical protein
MKARIKATGEIVEIVGEGIQNSNMVMAAHGEWFTKDELDIVPLSWKPFEPTYWQKLEHTYAGMAMQGVVNSFNNRYRDTRALRSCITREDSEKLLKESAKVAADVCYHFAHALVEKYKKEE